MRFFSNHQPTTINQQHSFRFQVSSLAFSCFCAFLFFPAQSVLAREIIPNDPYITNQWYLAKIHAPEAWVKNTGSADVVVAVLDSGVQIDHPDLKDNIWVNAKEIPNDKKDNDNNGYIDDANGWDFVSNTNDPSPKFNEMFIQEGILHGTSVASIIAAKTHNEKGIAGVNWVTKIMPLRVLNSAGTGTSDVVAKAIEYAVKNGADVINLSFSGPATDTVFEEVVKKAYDSGVVVVAAAGNATSGLLDVNSEGFNLNKRPMYPACSDSGKEENFIIGVAAVDRSDRRSTFSNYGSKCIDISAPGEDIFTASVYQPYIYGFGKYYDGPFSGTSQASPIVSGVVAAIKGINPALPPKEITRILLESVDEVTGDEVSTKEDLGKGRVNLLKAVESAIASRLTYVPSAGTASAEGTAADFSLAVGPKSQEKPYIKLFDLFGKETGKFFAYPENFLGGVSLEVADINGGGEKEIISGAGTGGGPQIRIFKSDGTVISQFFAFDKSFLGGIDVSAGDVNGDGKVEIIAVPLSKSKPEVRIFDTSGKLLKTFLAYSETFQKGMTVFIGDADGNGMSDILTAPNAGGGPQIRIFKSDGTVISQFFAFDPSFRGGVGVSM